jgi:2-oxoglutarate dehydrogenase E1 component
LPSDKKFISKISKIVTDRKTMYDNDVIDWGTAETLAYGSLLTEGYEIRVSGQDVERGTFSHRHAVVKVEDSEEEVVLLNTVKGKKGKFNVFNSFLSEYGVLGFDYGYALTNPNALTIWEAQFGDFVNGAQVVIDQFIASGEVKWGRVNGLVLMLPHGYEGQGPEHSSARPERFMQLCADMNMQVVQPTTASQIFHLLRRQMIRQFRKPLIIMTPKSLLRNKDATSPVSEFTKGEFKTVFRKVFFDAKAYNDYVKSEEFRAKWPAEQYDFVKETY